MVFKGTSMTANDYITENYSTLEAQARAYAKGFDEVAADDLFQEGMLHLLERESHYDPDKGDIQKFYRMLFVYGMKNHIQKLDKHLKVRTVDLQEPVFPDADPEDEYELTYNDIVSDDYILEDDVIFQEDIELMQECLKTLSARERHVLMASMGDSGGLASWAETEGVSHQMASKIKNRAINKLRGIAAQKGLEA